MDGLDGWVDDGWTNRMERFLPSVHISRGSISKIKIPGSTSLLNYNTLVVLNNGPLEVYMEFYSPLIKIGNNKLYVLELALARDQPRAEL